MGRNETRRLSERSRAALAAARREALALGHSTWSTQHVLLALTKLGVEGEASRALSELGVTREGVRALVVEHFPEGEVDQARGEPHPSLALREALTHARWLAAYHRTEIVDPQHLLLAMLWDRQSIAAQLLGELGITFEDAYRTLTGADTPPELLPDPVPELSSGEPVYVRRHELEPLLQRLHKHLPPEATYAFNFDKERAWFWSNPGVDLESAVGQALASE